MSYIEPCNFDFSSAYTGLTLNAQLYNADGTTNGAAITTGFAEKPMGSGSYFLAAMIPDNFQGKLVAYKSTDATLAVTVVLGSEAANVTSLAAIKAKTDNLPSAIQKNTARRIPFKMVLTDHTTPGTGLMIVAKVSLDGGAFATCAGTVTEISLGWYYLDATASDLNGDSVALTFTSATADTRDIAIMTEP